ncbi:hypothetical protein LWE61_15050 [Sphingobium sufflavum]|uniref:hypothetical protein n=1 Tax=Sphingobium sufflavum TaxID=1129547 RepID=UPI001F283E7E|nr:hypothetical protein [Sphingobium sufflavum]MCE7797868.1 hypothetical protein [Sphingobium sufflavum]
MTARRRRNRTWSEFECEEALARALARQQQAAEHGNPLYQTEAQEEVERWRGELAAARSRERRM